MDINIKKLIYYFLKLYKSPTFDRFIDLEQVENLAVLVFDFSLQNSFFFIKINISFFFMILKEINKY